jgi:23S rRNA pseudouridine2605 synthase
VVSVGRLDLNSEGLLIFTNQGSFAHHAESPQTGWERSYRVRVFGDVPVRELEDLKNGITIDGIHYKSIDIDVEAGSSSGRNHWLYITLTEGKNREIRHVMRHFDLHVNRLIRLGYGPFTLGSLKTGEVKEVSGRQLKSLFPSLMHTGQ